MAAYINNIAQPSFPATEQLLVQGGDARIALDQNTRLNKYGCRPTPDPELVSLGSSTASGISIAGFAAADLLRNKLTAATDPPSVIYARELERQRHELLDLCGVSNLPGTELVFAASGTDAHLIAGQLVAACQLNGCSNETTLTVILDNSEIGSGVPAALAGCHFSSRAALGGTVTAGAPLADVGATEIVNVPVRFADGTPRSAADIDNEFESIVTGAVAQGRRVLLVLVDVSKTGLIAPSPARAMALQRRSPDTVTVLVDACQFRIAPATLRAYLELGFMVALTGSKFLTGPTFSGALLIPATVACRLRGSVVGTLSAYSAKPDWPQDWQAKKELGDSSNFGLLLRWEAALIELRAFRLIPEPSVAAFLKAFAEAIQNRLMNDPFFEPLPVAEIDRRPLIESTSWDHIPTIFPFLLCRTLSSGDKEILNSEETTRIYGLLQTGLPDDEKSSSIITPRNVGTEFRFQLGQPVACGTRKGDPVRVLRICASARMVVAATSGEGRQAVINMAMRALDKAAMLIRESQHIKELVGQSAMAALNERVCYAPTNGETCR